MTHQSATLGTSEAIVISEINSKNSLPNIIKNLFFHVDAFICMFYGIHASKNLRAFCYQQSNILPQLCVKYIPVRNDLRQCVIDKRFLCWVAHGRAKSCWPDG